MNKKRIAQEFIYFLCSFVFGLFVFPVVLFIIFTIIFGQDWSLFGDFYERFYEAMFDWGYGFEITWTAVLAPYFIFQVIRSIVWAWKTVRTK